MLPDLQSFRPARVMMEGRDVARDGRATVELPRVDWEALGLRREFLPRDLPLEVREPLPVIEFVSNAITRSAGSESSLKDGDLLGILADREGRWATRAWIRNFAPGLDGLASSYNTAMHLLVLGRDGQAMQRAAEAVAASDGGIALGDGWKVELPITGMMMHAPFAETVLAQAELERRVRAAGFSFPDILYSLLFLCCDFLPGPRLTPRGVLDVKSGEIVSPALQTLR
jgi:adenine deaminase